MFKSTSVVSASVVIALAAYSGVCAIAIAAGLQGNIPASRLNGNTYTSPDRGFTLTLPPLLTTGAKAEERQTSPVQTGVFFADDLGNVYYILRTDNTQSKYSLEKVAAGYTINDALREKQIVSSARGPELRLAAVLPGSSPIVRTVKGKGKKSQQHLDLHQAMSLFLSDTQIYEVAAGVTATHQESDAEAFALAKQHLNEFLGGLRISATPPPTN